MSYQWNGTSSRCTVSGTPATLGWTSGSMWFYPTDGTLANQCLFGEVNTDGINSYGVWFLSTSDGDKCVFKKVTGAGTSGEPKSVLAANLNAWNHLYWSYNPYASPALLQLSLNGETLVTATASLPVGATSTATCIGYCRTGISTGASWFKGYIAEVSLYNDTMDFAYPDRHTALAKRWSPQRIMPNGVVTGSGLTHYWPMRKSLTDIISVRTASGGGSSPTILHAEHPPIRYPTSGKLIVA